jgi:hypothetical protein
MTLRLGVKKGLRAPLVWYRQRGLTSHDVLIASYPRSGSTWLRLMLYDVLTGEPSGFDVVNQAIPYVGRQRRARPLLPKGGRLLQTHERLPGRGIRVVYVVRDMRDVLVSEYRAQRRAGTQLNSLDEFVRNFLKGQVHEFGSWQEHVSSWLSASRHADMFLLRYEDLRVATEAKMRELLQFLDLQTPAPKISAAIQSNSLERMQKKEATASPAAFATVDQGLRFVGEGLVEGWRRRLTPEQVQAIERESGSLLSHLGYAVG